MVLPSCRRLKRPPRQAQAYPSSKTVGAGYAVIHRQTAQEVPCQGADNESLLVLFQYKNGVVQNLYVSAYGVPKLRCFIGFILKNRLIIAILVVVLIIFVAVFLVVVIVALLVVWLRLFWLLLLLFRFLAVSVVLRTITSIVI